MKNNFVKQGYHPSLINQHSRTNKQRYFTIQTVRQNMPVILWSVQYGVYSMSVKTRHHSTLD